MRTKIKDLEPMVIDILENYPPSRTDDYRLYLKVIERINPEVLRYPTYNFLQGFKIFGLPNWKTIERIRRKVQPADFRYNVKDEYMEYSQELTKGAKYEKI